MRIGFKVQILYSPSTNRVDGLRKQGFRNRNLSSNTIRLPFRKIYNSVSAIFVHSPWKDKCNISTSYEQGKGMASYKTPWARWTGLVELYQAPATQLCNDSSSVTAKKKLYCIVLEKDWSFSFRTLNPFDSGKVL